MNNQISLLNQCDESECICLTTFWLCLKTRPYVYRRHDGIRNDTPDTIFKWGKIHHIFRLYVFMSLKSVSLDPVIQQDFSFAFLFDLALTAYRYS